MVHIRKTCYKCAAPVVKYTTSSGHKETCPVHQEWLRTHQVPSIAVAATTAPSQPSVQPTPTTKPIVWACGVTTVPERKNTLLPRTLASIEAGGFPKPHLFVDGEKDSLSWYNQFRPPHITVHYSNAFTHGNWVLAAHELFIKNPTANRYVIFQDDVVMYKNLRQYLDVCEYPPEGYCNLYTFPENHARFPFMGKTKERRLGWWLSNQKGLGACGLVFDQRALITLLLQRHLLERPLSPERGKVAVDGGIVSSMVKTEYREYVHNPSLIQHIGDKSSMRHAKFPKAPSFKGEEYDAANLLEEVKKGQ